MSLHRITFPEPASMSGLTAASGVGEVLAALMNLGIAGFALRTTEGVVIEAEIRLVSPGREPARTAATAARLTTRQREVLSRIAGGGSTKTIARDLDLSPATIKVHTAAAIATLGAANRTDAVMRARQMQLI